MSQITKQSLAIVLLSSVMITSCTPKAGETKTELLKPVYESHIADDNFRSYVRFISGSVGIHKSKTEETEVKLEATKLNRPQIDNVPLSDSLLDYIYEVCENNDIPYSLMLAIIAVESNFNPRLVSTTADYGLTQVHKPNIKPFAQAAGIENVDPLNPEHSVLMTAHYLTYLKEKWSDPKYKFSEEQKYFMTVLAYNRGEVKALEWVRNNGWKNTYVSKISKMKKKFETNTYEVGE